MAATFKAFSQSKDTILRKNPITECRQYEHFRPKQANNKQKKSGRIGKFNSAQSNYSTIMQNNIKCSQKQPPTHRQHTKIESEFLRLLATLLWSSYFWIIFSFPSHFLAFLYFEMEWLSENMLGLRRICRVHSTYPL